MMGTAGRAVSAVLRSENGGEPDATRADGRELTGGQKDNRQPGIV